MQSIDMARSQDLTPQQAKFVEEYLTNGRNAAAAYRAAYPGNASAKTIWEQASKTLAHPKVRTRIEAAEAKARTRLDAVADEYAVSKERISRELARLAFSDARKFFDWSADGVRVKSSNDLTGDQAAAVIEVSQTVTENGGTIRVKMADKRQALMDLAKLHGHVVERKDVRVVKSVKDLSDEELEAIVAEGERSRGEGTRH